MSADPEPRRLVLLRHGRTAWNLTRRAQGHADVELDDLGHRQAAALAPQIALLAPTALWSSDLSRARQTAAYVEKETGLVARLDPRLREYDVGERAGLTMPEFAAQLPEEYAEWHRGRYEAVPGAESTADVLARMEPACRELLACVGPGETAVAVTHGAALKVALAALLGWDRVVAETLGVVENCRIAVLQERRDRASMRLVAYNATPDFASFEASG